MSLSTAGVIDTGEKIITGGKFTTVATSISANLGKVLSTNVAGTCCKFATCINNAGGPFVAFVIDANVACLELQIAWELALNDNDKIRGVGEYYS